MSESDKRSYLEEEREREIQKKTHRSKQSTTSYIRTEYL